MNTTRFVDSLFSYVGKVARYVTACVGALVIFALKPFLFVRLGSLVSYRIGSYSMEPELALCEKDAGLNQPLKFTFDIWFEEPPISNLALSVIWRRTLRVWPDDLVHPTYLLIQSTGILRAHIIRNTARDRDVHRLLQKSQSHLVFSSAEIAIGTATFREFGIPDNAKWICVHSRDSTYLESQFPEVDFSYHSYRDSDISTYRLMVETMISLGYYVVRMGSRVAKPMVLGSHLFFDYASSGRQTDLMDLFLIAGCTFYVGGSGGLDSVAWLLRRPSIATNHIPIANFHIGFSHLVIPKKLRILGQPRFLTTEEISKLGLEEAYRTSQYRDAGVVIVDNSSEEIRDVAIELHENICGLNEYSEADECLQKKFWQQFPLSTTKHGHGEILCRVGRQFLIENQWLLNHADKR